MFRPLDPAAPVFSDKQFADLWIELNRRLARAFRIEPRTAAVIVQITPRPFGSGEELLIPVLFNPPFLDNQYAVTATIVGSSSDFRPLSIESKTPSQCVIRLVNEGSMTTPAGVDVIAREAIIEEFTGYSGS